MKQLLIITLLICANTILMAQQTEPVIFHSQLERRLYELNHHSPFQDLKGNNKAFNTFSLKLDSVVGSNDFDWSRFMNHFAYDEAGNCVEEIAFEWDNAWIPTVKQVLTGAEVVFFHLLLGLLNLLGDHRVLDDFAFLQAHAVHDASDTFRTKHTHQVVFQ